MRNYSLKTVIFFCTIIFVFTEFLGWLYIGPISLRNWGLILVLGYLINVRCKYDKKVYKSFKYLVLYYAFVSILGLFNGLYIEEGAMLIFARFLPTVALFCLITFVINDIHKLTWLVYSLLAIMAFDALATILQGIGDPIGWILFTYFHSPEMSEATTGYVGENSIGYSIASGLNGTVVGNGYFLASYGLLFWYPYYKKRSLLSFIISIALAVLCLFALFYNQQRMAFYTYLLMVLVIIALLLPSKGKRYLFIVFYFIVAVVLFSTNILSSFDSGRLADVSSEDVATRHIVHDKYYSEFFPYHFLTGDRHQFIIEYGQTPHNMIIETILLGGIIGLCMYLLFVLSLVLRCLKDFLNKKRMILFAIPILTILLISWEHSSGFHTGMTLGAYLLALYEKSLIIDDKTVT